MDIGGNVYIFQSPHASCGKPSAYVCMGLIGEEVQGSSSNKKQSEDGRITELQKSWVLGSLCYPLHLLFDSLVPEYQEESLFKLPFYPRSPWLCVCFCVMHCRSWSLHWCTKQTPLPSSVNFWGVLVPFPREQGYWCIYPLTFILFHLWSQSAVTCLEVCRQKAVSQNINTMFCRTNHYHSQFVMCHIKTLGWSVFLGWDLM